MKKIEDNNEEKYIVQRSKFDKNNKLIILDEPVIRQVNNIKPNHETSKISVLDVLKPLKAYNVIVGKDKQGLYTIKSYGRVITYIADTKVGCSVYEKTNGSWKARSFVKKSNLDKKISELTIEI